MENSLSDDWRESRAPVNKLPSVILWKWVEQIQPLKASDDASNNHFNDSKAAFQHSMGTEYKNNYIFTTIHESTYQSEISEHPLALKS